MRTVSIALAAVFLCTASFAQDSPSLGDLARQVRAQKQQKDAKAKDAAPKDTKGTDAPSTDPNATDATQPKTSQVITNEELPDHAAATTSSHHASSMPSEPVVSAADHEVQGEQWRSQIQSQKTAVASLQREIAELNSSIHYAGGNCVANCAQWNERQQQKQEQVDSMKAQLEEQQRRLEDMQDAARKQGFGSSIYDP